jgi:IS30 family transposase
LDLQTLLVARWARGVRFGCKTKLNEQQRQEARRRLEAGESTRSIGKILGVHHATVLAAA